MTKNKKYFNFNKKLDHTNINNFNSNIFITSILAICKKNKFDRKLFDIWQKNLEKYIIQELKIEQDKNHYAYSEDTYLRKKKLYYNNFINSTTFTSTFMPRFSPLAYLTMYKPYKKLDDNSILYLIKNGASIYWKENKSWFWGLERTGTPLYNIMYLVLTHKPSRAQLRLINYLLHYKSEISTLTIERLFIQFKKRRGRLKKYYKNILINILIKGIPINVHTYDNMVFYLNKLIK